MYYNLKYPPPGDFNKITPAVDQNKIFVKSLKACKFLN